MLILSFGTTILEEDVSSPHLDVRSFSAFTKILVAASVLDESYRSAVSLGMYIVTPLFLKKIPYCRTKEDLEEEAKRCRLGRFTGVRAFLVGFNVNSERVQKMKNDIMFHGGHIVQTEDEATHVIASKNIQNMSNLNTDKIYVSKQWYFASMELPGCCANEVRFPVKQTIQRRKTKGKSLLSRSLTFMNSGKEDKSRIEEKLQKRHSLCQELYTSEVNCLRFLDFLCKLGSSLTCINNEENDCIFGSIFPLEHVHSELVTRVGQVIHTWTNDSTIGNIFVEMAEDLNRAYITYFLSVEAATEKYKYCLKKNARFKTFMEETEKDRTLGKQKIEYLLMMPWQQLTSRISVILKEILKYTDESSVNYRLESAAVEAIDRVLRESNEIKAKSDKTAAIYKTIKQVPSYVLCTSEQFIDKLNFFCQPDQSTEYLNVDVLLFDMHITIAKSLLAPSSCIPIASFRRNKSRTGSQFLATFTMNQIREIEEIYDYNGTTYLVTLRKTIEEVPWRFVVKSDHIRSADFFERIAHQVEKVTQRQLIIKRLHSFRHSQWNVNSLEPGSLNNSPSMRKLKQYKRSLSKIFSSTTKLREPICTRDDHVALTLSPVESNLDENSTNPYEGIKRFHQMSNGLQRQKIILDDCC